VISRLRLTLFGIRLNLVRGWQEMSGMRSFLQWIADVVLYRVMALVPIESDRLRTIRFKGGPVLSYRRKRSDFRTVAETWLTLAYELPIEIDRPRLIVDLGTNIGATATWMAHRYGCERLIAVEPVPGNAAVARRNLAANGINAEIHEAAIGAEEGVGFFADSPDASEGHVSDEGREVRLVTVPGLIGDQQVDLMKMDIEGGEGEAINGNIGWLDQVKVIVTELHPQYADTDRIVRTLQEAGFEYHVLPGDPDSISGPEFMAGFWRPES
jgi:FkbM family methyltransferase